MKTSSCLLKSLVVGWALVSFAAVPAAIAGSVQLPSLFQMDNVRAMAWLAKAGLNANVRLVPKMSSISVGHGRVDMQWPPSTTTVAPGSAVTILVANHGKGKNAVPSPFASVKLSFDLHSTRLKSGHMITSSGAGGQTSKTDFFGYHFKGCITGCAAKKVVLVRMTGKLLKGWSKVSETTIGQDGRFELRGTARGPLEMRFLDSADGLVYYYRSKR